MQSTRVSMGRAEESERRRCGQARLVLDIELIL